MYTGIIKVPEINTNQNVPCILRNSLSFYRGVINPPLRRGQQTINTIGLFILHSFDRRKNYGAFQPSPAPQLGKKFFQDLGIALLGLPGSFVSILYPRTPHSINPTPRSHFTFTHFSRLGHKGLVARHLSAESELLESWVFISIFLSKLEGCVGGPQHLVKKRE